MIRGHVPAILDDGLDYGCGASLVQVAYHHFGAKA